LIIHNKKTRISAFAYPLYEVLGRPVISNKATRNPRAYISNEYTLVDIYCFLFSKITFEDS